MNANYAPPAELGGTQTKALIIGIVGLLAGIGGAIATGGQRMALQSYLVAYVFWTGISLGCLGLLMVQYLGGAGWGLLIRRILESGAHVLVPMFVGFAVLVFALYKGGLYGWTHPPEELMALMKKKEWWLNKPGFVARGIIYFVIWFVLLFKLRSNSHKQDATGDPATLQSSQDWSGPGFLIYGLALTFASIDWIMSLDAEWFSAIFGLLMLVGWAVSTFAVIIWVCVSLAKRAPFDHIFKPKFFHDLGKLQFASTMLWAYFSFSQLVIIWSGNLPEEIPFYIERFKGVWRYMGIAIIVFHFFVPFVLLLSRDIKRHANRLKWISLLLLLMRFVDLIWYIVPEFQNQHGEVHDHSIIGLQWYILAMLGMGGLWFWWFLGQLRSRALLPINDPQLPEALAGGGGH